MSELQTIKDEIEVLVQNAETESKKLLADAALFARSTLTALAHDPKVTAAIQAGFAGALAAVSAAVETGGAGCLPAAAIAAGRSLALSAGVAAEHQLIPIVIGELHAAAAGAAAAVPEHVNP